MSKAKLNDPIFKPFAKSLQMLGITSDEITEAMYDLRMEVPPLDVSLKLQLEQDGFEAGGEILENKDIIFSEQHEYFLFKKRPVLVYIRDQYVTREDYEQGKLNRFHVCFCPALEQAKHQHRLKNRYIVTTNTSGRFFVNIEERGSGLILESDVYKELDVCQNCLREINWKNFRSYCGAGEEWWSGGNYKQRQKIISSFSIDEFLKSVRRDLFSGAEGLSAYAARKEYKLSQEFKNDLKYQCGYRCQKCGRLTVKSNLQIHHRDHNEGNNSKSNLMVVCSECHKRIHRSEGGYIGDSIDARSH